jgi:hypothetical protein
MLLGLNWLSGMTTSIENCRSDDADDTPVDDYTAAMKTTLRLLLLAILLLLASCGNKGDLVLPTKPLPTHG